MQVIAISDTHNQLNKISIPNGDILVHAGDWTNLGSLPELTKFGLHLARLPHKHKIIIGGNHDRLLEDEPSLAQSCLPTKGVHYLQDSGVEINGIKFWGSPYSLEFCNWGFQLPRYSQETIDHWAKIPEDTDVLVVHGPALGFGDRVPEGHCVGDPDLLNRIKQLPNLKYVISGHIHHDYGQWKSDFGPTFINAAICDESYHPVNSPVPFQL